MTRTERDFYDILGVPRTASAEEIQRAYRQLARRHHPDLNKDPGAEERFKEISEAYHVLSDPNTRRRYDRYGRAFRQVPEGAGGPFGGRPGGGQGRASGGARGRGARPGYGGGVRVESTGGAVDIDDLLGSMFAGGGFGGFGGGPVPGADAEADIAVTVEEAYHGGRRTVVLSTSDGQRELDVTVPAGVTDGQRIRLAGQGSSGLGDGRPGDLYLVVRLAPHPRYRVHGRDITARLPVSAWEAALGARVGTETPGGRVEVIVPAGSSCGRRLRLRGRGLPDPRGTPGDFFAEVQIVVPSRLTDRERGLFEELSQVSAFDPRQRAER
jgi:curved DNA-binding protein